MLGKHRRFLPSAQVVLLCLLLPALAPADDWPTYRHDARRSGISGEDIPAPLAAAWVFTNTQRPTHAWGDPQPKPVESQLELPRSRFDDAFHLAAVGDLVYFGSSGDNTVYALDAATGGVRWKFVTGAPVRLAPTVHGGKVYAGSDDGRVYCLDASSGKAVWVFSAAPSPEMLLGNGKMISVWPVRTGVVVEGDTAYFGAGVFPAEGLYLYAVRARDGKLLWKNDSYGIGGRGTVSPQGYMLASRSKLFVSSSRAMPAAFSRTDGRFLFHRNFNWREIGMFGGTYSLLADGYLYNGVEQVVAVRQSNGRLAFTEGIGPSVPSAGSRRLVVDKDVVYILTGEKALAARKGSWIQEKIAGDLQRKLRTLKKNAAANPQLARHIPPLEKQLAAARESSKKLGKALKWSVPLKSDDAVALTQRILFAGGENSVVALDVRDGKNVWEAPVKGRARSIAVASGRLLVSTDKGVIHCFVPRAGGSPRKVAPRIASDPFAGDGAAKERYAKAAEAIVREGGVTRGYALILGGGEGRLALELARRTELTIYMVEPDGGEAERARDALSAAGVYGARVTVLEAPLGAVPYADYFANLIICEDSFASGATSAPPAQVLRMLKPCGGVVLVGRPPVDAAGAKGGEAPGALRKWLDRLRKTAGAQSAGTPEIAVKGSWARIERGPLPGAGTWTHEYAEPGNTATSNDRFVRGPIGILWYGEPGPKRMPSRHAANVAPLSVGGVMFTEGENVLMAHDAYNGLELWTRDMKGALRLHMQTGCSNFAASGDSLFVAIGDRCRRIDMKTGRTLRTYRAPAGKNGQRTNWLYTAYSGGLVYGSRKADGLFAIDVDSGELRWKRDAGSLQVTSVCISGGRLFYVDRRVTKEQEKEALKGIAHEMRLDRLGKPIKPDVRLVVALDAATGKAVWEHPQYLSDCVGVGKTGGDVTAMATQGVLLLCGQPWNGHFWHEFFAGEFSRRSLIALSAEDGHRLWSGRKGYRSRPLIVGDTVVAEPWAYSLRTGKEKMRPNPITGEPSRWQIARPGHHCGNIAAAPNALFFRSGTTAYYDLNADYGTAHFGAQRPGCWINCIPASGVVMMPEASSGCICPFSIQCTIVFEHRGENRVWGMFSSPGPLVPVKHLAVNFGAPGDRRDSGGTLWLAYPRPYGGVREEDRRLVMALPLEVQMGRGGGYYNADADFLDAGGGRARWVFASGARGLKRCLIPLRAPGQKAAAYTVKLYFRDPVETAAGRRVFSVSLGGKTVLENFDIVQEAGGGGKVLVKEFRGIRSDASLELGLQPVRGAPIMCGIEIVQE